MWYVIRGVDVAESLELRRGARDAHLARLRELRDAGRLLASGPLPAIDASDPGPAGFVGSVVIAEFASLDEARRWADGDPYLECGAWTRAHVDPFVLVLP